MKWALVWGEIGRHAAPGTTGIAGKAAYPGPHGPNGRVPDSLDEAKRGALGGGKRERACAIHSGRVRMRGGRPTQSGRNASVDAVTER